MTLIIPSPYAGLVIPTVRAFHPKNLAQAVAVFDYTDPSILFAETTGAAASTPTTLNGMIGTAKDMTGKGGHQQAPGASNGPVLRQSGGRYYAEFNGSSQALDIFNTSLLNVTADAFICAGYRWRSTVSGARAAIGTNAGDRAIGHMRPTSSTTNRAYVATTVTATGANGSAISNGVDFVSDLDWTRSTGVFVNRINGATDITINMTPANLNPPTVSYTLGTAGNSGAVCAPIDAYRMVYCSGTLTAGEKTAIRQWVADGSGVTL